MMEYTNKYWNMLMPFIKKSLNKRYGKAYTKALIPKADAEYRDMYDLFNKDAILTPVDSGEFIVLEIKYNGKLLSYISNILKKYKLTRTAYSKYCSSRPNFYDYLG